MTADFTKNIPAEITKRLLEHGSRVAMRSASLAAEFSNSRDEIRESLDDVIGAVPDDVLNSLPVPSVAAVDGALICDAKSIGDLCSAVGVRVGPDEGQSDSDVWMDLVPRSVTNRDILGGVMSSMEIRLAAESKADVVLIDGSMLSTMLNVAKGLAASRGVSNELSARLGAIASPDFFAQVMTILSSARYVAMPKYTTTNEFADRIPEKFGATDARTIMTLALRPGEMTYFSVRERDQNSGDKFKAPYLGFNKENQAKFTDALEGVVSCYYRPHAWTPAFRLDMIADALHDDEALLRALKAVRDSTTVSGMREPVPLYLVDLFAKSISEGTAPVVDMAVLSEISDPEVKLLLAMGYRT